MGNSCSSGQAHKDKDNMSQRSEESGSYQVRTSLPSDKQQTLLNHVTQQQHSGVILEPSTAGQQAMPEQQLTTSAAPSAFDRKPNLSKVLKGVAATSISADSMSLSSPPGTQSPKDFDKINGGYVPKEVASLSENLQNLIMGRVSQVKTSSRAKKIVIYVSAADSEDSCVEKGALHDEIYPELRAHCRQKGYELHIVDLHWKCLLERQQDHEFPELCIGELTRQAEVGYIIPVVFLHNTLGMPLLPITMESADFTAALDGAGDESAQALLSKWYQLDNNTQPPCYRLQPISNHIPGFKEASSDKIEKGLDELRSEIDKILEVLITVFSQELRDTYLTTVLEQEIHNTVFMSQELAKRCIWMNRVYTPIAKTPDDMNPSDAELYRRFTTLQKDLRNQLTEKHILRVSVRYIEGGLSLENYEHSQYISQVVLHLKKQIKELIDSIIEEHQAKVMLKPSYGIEPVLFEELDQQTSFCQKTSQCSVHRESTLDKIKTYITDNSTCPMILHGPEGCGKTTLMAKVAQNCQSWLPEAFLILRFVGISAQSTTVEQLLSSITNQCSILTYGYKCYCTHNIETYEKILPSLLAATCIHRPLIVILDGLDQVAAYSDQTITWLPTKLPDNIKLIVTVSDNSDMYQKIAETIKDCTFLRIPGLGESEAKDVLMSSARQYNVGVSFKIQDYVLKSAQECTLPLYAKVLAWQTSWWADKEHSVTTKGDVQDQLGSMLEELEVILGKSEVQKMLALISSTKHGIAESEIIDLLAFDESLHNNIAYLPWAPVCLSWSRLNKYLAPFFQWSLASGVLCVRWRDNLFKKAATAKYKEHSKWANQVLYDYFNGKWWDTKPEKVQARLMNQDTILGTCYNKRKLDELPYQHHHLNTKQDDLLYISDVKWIYDKVCGSNCFEILEDIRLRPDTKNEVTGVLKNFLEAYAGVLNYDGRQFYSHLYRYLQKKLDKTDASGAANDSKLVQLYGVSKNPPVLSLVPVNSGSEDVDAEDGDLDLSQCSDKTFDLIVRLPGTDQFVVSVSMDKEELCVWDVSSTQKVRTLKGIPQPMNVIPIDKYKCIVLCRRELRIYDLNTGEFVTKLKGVMNQKMPYFGLHDESHLVALSRNRMYINLMNLQTGDCVTTFKAGEDRFLNSLLVSGDGRVLVCGDETQKPFPLLVWNLQSKKLLYDLRIPHHDFVTSLAAITYEGSYVCCVCHEIDEPNPNFIVVYDLQSGTLFKKWKPSCNTVSLEISSQGGCVISGLEDARILVWDLITGNCRWSLYGHTAPVSLLKLDPTGSLCMSSDSECRDRSIRIWDLNKGNLVAVYTPRNNITASEITSNGHYITLALDGCEELLTLQLRGPGVQQGRHEETYGAAVNCGKVFQMSEDGKC